MPEGVVRSLSVFLGPRPLPTISTESTGFPLYQPRYAFDIILLLARASLAVNSLEEKIRILCAQVIAEPPGPKFDAAISELREAMREHFKEIRRLIRVYPPQPPLELTKRQAAKISDPKPDDGPVQNRRANES